MNTQPYAYIYHNKEPFQMHWATGDVHSCSAILRRTARHTEADVFKVMSCMGITHVVSGLETQGCVFVE